ncbi:adenylyltransferase/cytidyltransferase family protein [Chloroflexota bacterium]
MLVAVCGKFDPLHNGHVDHIIKASKLGDTLLVITGDDDIVAMGKGVCYIPLSYRILILEGLLLRLGIEGSVVVSIDKDGTATETIRKYKPDILAKGGDRTESNMPRNEVEACKVVGCKIVYGIGDLLNSSSRMVKHTK